MDLKTNCRYFKGDRPCQFYWETFKLCDSCGNYNPIKERILIIKQDAIGDVLRATPLLRALKEKYSQSQITWIVGKEAAPLLKNNDYIDRVLEYGSSLTSILLTEEFDLAINLDKDIKSTSLIEISNAKEKRGYGLSKKGVVYPLNKGAEYHYSICLDNFGLKRENKKSYVELIFEIAEIPFKGEEYMLKIPEQEQDFANRFLKKHSLYGKKIIGLNTGCGPVYPHKKWTEEHFNQLIKKFSNKKDISFLLFGGPSEEELNKRIKNKSKGNIINTGSDNEVLRFAALTNLCDIVLTGDTLGLHVSIALKKPIIAFFGPTPSKEIYPYGLVDRIEPKMDCLCCYDQFECKKTPNCMENISVEEVFDIIKDRIKL